MLEQAKSYELEDKPFAKALLLRATTLQDQGEKDLKRMLGKLKPTVKPRTFQELASSCAVTIASHITSKSMEAIDRKPAFLSGDPLLKDAPMVIAFSLFVLAGILSELKAEGIELEFKDLAIRTSSLLFFPYPNEDEVDCALNSKYYFHTLATSDAQNVKEWRDELMGLVQIYVMQWTTEDQELKKVDCIPLFGKYLNMELASVE